MEMKRWGFVAAEPSEFLIHVRNGRVLSTSGQGASCFKWPWDSVAFVPTTINRVQFVADQVTREKVGVKVSGLAVYRIVEPLIAFRMIDARSFSKLDGIINEMFVGATRRLVANLGVEDVMKRRKDALATELMREIAPIVEGRGRPQDGTHQGWGIAVDTIEIQNVRVLSEEVFAQMQASYRADLLRESQMAELDAHQEVEARRGAIAERARMAQIDRRQREIAAERAMNEAEQEAKLQALADEATLSARRREESLEELRLLEARGRLDNALAAEASEIDHQVLLRLIERAAPILEQAVGKIPTGTT